MDAITVLLKTVLPFRRTVRPLNGSATYATLLKKTPDRLQRFLRSTAVVRFQNWHVSVTGTVPMYDELRFIIAACD